MRAPTLPWFLLLGTVLAGGCARPGPFSEDPAVAARQVEKVLPRGLSEKRAREALSLRGFTLSRLSTDRAANHLLVATSVHEERMWQVGVVMVNAHVAGTSVTITDLRSPAR